MRDSLLETFHHPLAKKAYTFAAVVFAVAALAYHSQPEIGYHGRLVRWGLPAGSVGHLALRAWAAGAHRRVWRDVPRSGRTLLSAARHAPHRLSAIERGHVTKATMAMVLLSVVAASITPLVAVPGAFSDGTVAADGTVDEDTIYVGSKDGNLYALFANNGTEKWSYSIGSDQIQESSPVVEDGTVYFAAHDNNLHAVDAETGSQEWTYNLGATSDSSPTVVNGTVYIGGNGALHAVNAADGSKEWSRGIGTGGGAEVVDGTVYWGGDTLYALHASNGTTQWTAGTVSNVGTSSPAYKDGTVYIGDFDGNVQAINAADGSQEWSFSTGTSSIQSSATVVDGAVYIGSPGGAFHAIDASTGNQEWSYSTSNDFDTSPTVKDGVVYAGSWDNTFYAFDTTDGSVKWQEGGTSGWVSSPTIAEGTLYTGGTDNDVYAFNPSDGTVQWTFTTGSAVLSSPTFVAAGEDESSGTREQLRTLGHITSSTGSLGVQVSGSVTSDGSGIGNATLELRQSGSVVKSATTTSSGGYSFSSVGDGDYTVRASADGYQNSSKSITVSGSAVTADLTLPKEGTYVQSFRLDDPTGGFPADETVLELHEYQPGAALNGADPWTRVETSQLNSERKASFRLSEGTTYRVTAKNVVPNQRSAEQSWSGFVASPTLAQPYVLETELVLGDWGATPTPTSTPLTPTATPGPDATPTPTFAGSGGGGGGTLPDPNADRDGDGIDNVYDPDDDGDGTPDLDEPDQPSYDAYGPTYLSSCTLPSGEDGARIQYYDPGYNTTQLDYNLTGPGGAVYNGSESFDAPIGLWSECVAGTLTDNVTQNASDTASIVGNVTFENGSTVPLDADFEASGPSFQSFAPMGDPADTPAEQGTAFGLTALGVGASYLASRRTNVLQGLSARSPVDPVFAGGSALSVLMGLEFASGGAVSAATANGVQTAAPLAGLGAVGYGGYWVYTNYIQGQNVTIRGGS